MPERSKEKKVVERDEKPKPTRRMLDRKAVVSRAGLVATVHQPEALPLEKTLEIVRKENLRPLKITRGRENG